MLEIKNATLIQLEFLLELFEQYREFYKMPKAKLKSKAFLTQRIKQKDSIILLAYSNQQAAGFVQVYPAFSSVAMSPLWILNDLFVTSDFRQQGIAQKLLESIELRAKKEGVFSIKLATATDNIQAKKLYESCGYVMIDKFDHYSKRL
ncbi:GNAT family N-acetyltransferase [Aliikangiella sp. IMCC44359]|uniref:GNAT family N-acetyltransferase n=1 Tax=Aliikangiella sp. IMCC44359 TaxID=3459125 RepID=UPI00403A8E2D